MADSTGNVQAEMRDKAEEKALETLEEQFAKAGTQRGQLYAVIINGIAVVEACLSASNAVDQDAFQFASFEQSIYAGSAVMEFIGLIFAFLMTLYAYNTKDYGFGKGGSPLLMVRKARADSNDELMRIAVFPGFGAQALGLWLCLMAYVFTSDLPVGGVPIVMLTMALVRVLNNIIKGHSVVVGDRPTASESAESTCDLILTLGHLLVALSAFLAPVSVKVIESFFLFANAPSPDMVILAVLNIVSVLCGFRYITSFIFDELPALWISVLNYHS